jgi:hypothetical protein
MFWKEMHVGEISHERKHYLNEEVWYLHNSLHLNMDILNPCPILDSKCSWWARTKQPVLFLLAKCLLEKK